MDHVVEDTLCAIKLIEPRTKQVWPKYTEYEQMQGNKSKILKGDNPEHGHKYMNLKFYSKSNNIYFSCYAVVI